MATNYITRTLVTRNIDCANITCEEFVKAMFSDFLEAEEKYNENYIPEWEAWKLKSFKDHMKWIRKRATEYAEKKWKTEKKRNEYINNAVEKARKEYKVSTYYDSLGFFDFDLEPGKNGLSGNCCISYKGLTPKALERCFNEVKDNRYFKKATGWKFTYESNENSFRSCFRPHIDLIVDAETEAAMKKEAADLAEDIRRFYANCSYPGD